MGSSLYGALAYNGEKINEARGKLLATNKIYNDGTGTVDIGRALNDFLLYMPSQTRVEKPVVHISLNPHPEDRLTDTDLQNIAREYLEKLGFGEQPYMVYKHEDIDRHHVHIVTVNVDENGRRLNCDFLFAAVTAYAGSWRKNTGFVRQNAGASVLKIRCTGWMFLPVMSRGRSATL